MSNAREPHYSDDAVTLFHGDCLDVLRSLPDNSVDSVVTDPPAGIAFMGKGWDGDKGGREPWSAWLAEVMREALRVTKPGGHALVWALPRTAHWTACGLEDAGWEIRDRITHLFGSGFPKSLDVSRAIDKAAGATREQRPDPRWAERYPNGNGGAASDKLRQASHVTDGPMMTSDPATDAARQWQGWHTALKPGAEDWWVARKPLAAGTVAANVLAHGTGALNVDGCRVEANGERFGGGAKGSSGFVDGYGKGSGFVTSTAGRWPTNVVLDEHAAEELDAEVGTLKSGANPTRRSSDKFRDAYGDFRGQEECTPARGADEGGPSRFFPTFKYAAKAPTRERPSYVREGADGSVAGSPATSGRRCNVCGNQTVPKGGKPWPACGHDDWTRFETENRTAGKVAHPTVKPLALMQWLVRLVTPPGGVVLEPFAGSGTTVEACLTQGFRCIAIEREADYLPLIEARIARQQKPDVPTAAEALALFDFEEPA